MTQHKGHEGHEHRSNKKDNTNNFMIGTTVVMAVLLLAISFQLGTTNKNLGDIADKLDNLKLSGGVAPVAPAAAAPSAPTAPAAPTAPTPAPTVDMAGLEDDDAVKGDANAPVTIIEWSDYECPFCGRFYTQTLSQIDENYIKTGKVKLIYRDYPLSFHPNAQKAAEAAECAGEQDKYYEMHDKIFENKESMSVDSYKAWAADMGLDTDAFDSCLDNGDMAAEVAADMAAGQAAGVRGTPGFLINGRLISGAQPYSVFEQAIEDALGN